jgi:hypothetical protein
VSILSGVPLTETDFHRPDGSDAHRQVAECHAGCEPVLAGFAGLRVDDRRDDFPVSEETLGFAGQEGIVEL